VGLLCALGACSAAPGIPLCGGGALAAGSEAYVLDTGDALQVTVFRQENLSGEFALDATGSLALPLVGEIAARGRSARELETAIEDRLRHDGYLVDPDVSIEVLSHRPFYVLGEVAQPGRYEYVAGMTVVNAVALAGGYSYRADRDDVTIAHGDCARDANAVTKVLPGDRVRVPERFF